MEEELPKRKQRSSTEISEAVAATVEKAFSEEDRLEDEAKARLRQKKPNCLKIVLSPTLNSYSE